MGKTKIIFCLYLTFILGFTQLSILSADNKTNTASNNVVTDEKIVKPTVKKNTNKISDNLENILTNQKNDSQMIDVIVALDHPPNQDDITTFEKYGGIVIGTWDKLVYAFHGTIPQKYIQDYSSNDGIVSIEKNENITVCLDYSVKQIGVRPTVWNTYGYMGNSSQAIAILDTGIDDSHPDLSGKIVKWIDFTNDGYLNPIDKYEHGTHCAGIAAGTGKASGTATKKYTWSRRFSNEFPAFLVNDVYPTKSGTLSLTLQWDDDRNDGYGQAVIWIDKNQNGLIDPDEYKSGYQPLTYTVSVNAGHYQVGVSAYDTSAWNEDFYCQMNVPSQSLGDGHNLLTGVAPNCELAGLKVLNDSGQGTYNDIINALNWLATNASLYHITVASMSLGGQQSDIVDTAVNNLVASGVVCVVAAGNDQGINYVGSPGTAAKAITVGAVNDLNQLTDYSSLGDPGGTPLKPDVLAPGGSATTGDQIISVDSNDADNTPYPNPDHYPDDYRAMEGTSMACPHVAGEAALIADALGTWQYTAQQALFVKQIICMTSFEIESAENPSYTPPFDHGGKDNMEGYGRVCADAAIEAATMQFNNANNMFTFGSGASDKKVWARQVELMTGKTYTFTLNVPSTGNYDLYLYNKTPDSNGEPILLDSSYNSGSSKEVITYNCSENGIYYIVAKWRSGSGQASVTCQSSPPVCSFTYSPLHPTIHDVVSFNDTSNDTSIVSWSWNFGDGHTSLMQNPTHQYSTKGIHQVTHTVTDKYGSINSVSKNLTVINIYPTANFTYSPLNPKTSNTIQFTDTSTDSDGTVTSWSWTFGDGNSSTTENPTHRYSKEGTYTATLNVTDDDGATNAKSKSISVSNVPPVADFTYTPSNPKTSDIIHFNDTSTDSDGTVASWSWTFGDGNSSTLKNPTHRYTDEDTYTVTLNVTDDDGATNAKSKSISVSNVPPVADFTYTPSNPKTSDIIHFHDTSTDSDGSIVSWSWNFGDGTSSTHQNINHTYNDEGPYTVTLKVTDDDQAQSTTTKSISVSNVPPIANFTYSPLHPTDLQTIQFTDTSSDSDGSIANWTWRFGDNSSISFLRNPAHHFVNKGTYTVTLNVTDDDGAKNQKSHQITVINAPPTVNFTYLPKLPTIHDIVTFKDTSFDLDGQIVNQTWQISDGATYYSRNITHQFANNKTTYDVTLKVKDNDGNVSSLTKHIIMKANYSTTTLAKTETVIDLNKQIDINLIINTTSTTTVNIVKYSGNPVEKNITHNITALGKYYDVMVSNKNIVRWPIDIKIYYTQNDLSKSDTTETQFLGIYYWNIASGEWMLYNDTGVNTTDQDNYAGYLWVHAWHLTNITVGEDTIAPTKVTGLAVTDVKDGKLNLAWNAATDNIAVNHYKIYRNGAFIINRTSTTYQDTGLTNGQSYTYQVSAVDAVGNEGVKSDSKSGTPTNPPILSNPNPADGSSGVSNSNSSLSVVIHDPEGRSFSWTITTSPNIGSSSGTSARNGTKNCSVANLTYSTTYWWTVRVNDGVYSTNQTYTFTTISNGGGGSSGGGGGGGEILLAGPQNQYPIANASAGEPYQGFINSTILFDGSRSYDPDGNITKWLWVFGDNTNGTGKKINHTYSKAGKYTVTLTVTDNLGAINTDTTTCVITQPNRPPTKPTISGPTNGTKNTIYNYTAVSTDADNNTIRYSIIWGDETSSVNMSRFLPSGTPFTCNHRWTNAGIYTINVRASDNQTESQPTYLTVLIDVKYVGNLGYLIDQNGDRVYDKFYSNSTKNETNVQKQVNGTYLIDTNGDGKWDYSFDPTTSVLSIYHPPTPGFEIIIAIGAIALVLLWKRKSKK